jgi:4-hydroxybenzoyl-CoA thioesterase
MLTHRRKIQIEFGDCDPGGIVYFPRYCEYFDACTNALFKRAGLPKRRMLKTYAIAGIPLVETQARFLVPSQFGEPVVVESCVAKWGRSSFTVQHRLFKGNTLAVEVLEKRVRVARLAGGAIRYKGKTIPQEVKDRFAGSSRPRRA